jgi:hypothetical protein
LIVIFEATLDQEDSFCVNITKQKRKKNGGRQFSSSIDTQHHMSEE